MEERAVSEFYVYHHKNPKTGKTFYVGKGCKRRAWDKRKRSDRWKFYVAKHGVIVDISKSGMTEDEAFAFEVSEIKRIGASNLVNHTEGGDGCNMTWEQKNDMELKSIKDGLVSIGLSGVTWLRLSKSGVVESVSITA